MHALAKLKKLLYGRMRRYFSIVNNIDCYYVCHTVPVGVRVDKKFINLNYTVESPFPHYQLVYVKKGCTLNLWFIRHDQTTVVRGKFLIPESLLFAAHFRGTGREVVCCSASAEHIDIVAIRDGEIVIQCSKGKWAAPDDPQMLDILTREHRMVSPEMQLITSSEKQALLESGLEKLRILDLYGLWQKGSDSGGVLLPFAARYLPLTVILVAVVVGAEVLATWRLESKISTVDAKIAVLQPQVEPIQKIRQEQKKLEHNWREFVNNEIEPISPVELYFAVAEVISASSGELSRWDGTRDRVNFTVEVDSAPELLEKLRSIQGLGQIRIDGAVRKSRQNSREIATFTVSPPVAERSVGQ